MTETITKAREDPRTLVLCFDGTSNEYDADNTNVVKLFALLKKDDRKAQLCFYQPGLGTWYEPGVVSPLLRWAARMLDLAFATYLSAHVIDGYKFLMQNYTVGDRICIFGFSRGAYTARALGGFLYKVGLLPRDNNAQVQLAYKMYKRTDEEGLELCAGFKQTYCQSVEIDFMGVWDTVASVGVMAGRTLPFTTANSGIKVFRHALALDERRAKFRANSYYAFPKEYQDERVNTDVILNQTEVHEVGQDLPASPSSASSRGSFWNFFARSRNAPENTGQENNSPDLQRRKPRFIRPEVMNDVLEVWFAGCHGGCGIKFDHNALGRAKITNSPEPSKTEHELDESDALRTRHYPEGVWHRDLSIHMGRGRKIIEQEPVFHSTVRTRMESHAQYHPKARWNEGSELYV